jgi:hypothetical protein
VVGDGGSERFSGPVHYPPFGRVSGELLPAARTAIRSLQMPARGAQKLRFHPDKAGFYLSSTAVCHCPEIRHVHGEFQL